MCRIPYLLSFVSAVCVGVVLEGDGGGDVVGGGLAVRPQPGPDLLLHAGVGAQPGQGGLLRPLRLGGAWEGKSNIFFEGNIKTFFSSSRVLGILPAPSLGIQTPDLLLEIQEGV